jgi:hypothetical protein
MRGDAVNGLIVRTMPAGLRNGLPEPGGYVYRGTGRDTLTAFMDFYPCGTYQAYRRHLSHGEKPCEDCARAQRREWNKRQMKKAQS